MVRWLHFTMYGLCMLCRFGQESVEKMKNWALKHVLPTSDPFIVEIGVGNGNLLFALLEEGYNAKRMAGVDYSPDAIRLARSIAQTKEAEDITFESSDFLNDDLLKLDGMDGCGWDLVLDKGTYDAMALAERDETGKKPCDVYPCRVAAVLKPGGYFLITCQYMNTFDRLVISDLNVACNFTYDELIRIFATQETGLTFQFVFLLNTMSSGFANVFVVQRLSTKASHLEESRAVHTAQLHFVKK